MAPPSAPYQLAFVPMPISGELARHAPVRVLPTAALPAYPFAVVILLTLFKVLLALCSLFLSADVLCFQLPSSSFPTGMSTLPTYFCTGIH